jgi:hypothetical protein
MIEMVIGGIAAVVTQILKKINLPSKWAPFVVLGLAVVCVGVAKALGITADVETLQGIIAKGLGIGAATISIYDIIKQWLEPTK